MNIGQLVNMKKVSVKERIEANAWITIQNSINEKDANEFSDELEDALIAECFEANIINELL